MSEKSLSKILSKLMFEKNIRTTELARQINVPQPTLHRLISGKCKRPHQATLQPIANYFGMSVAQLIGQEPISSIHEPIIEHPKINRITVIQWKDAANWPHLKDDPPKNFVISDKYDHRCYALIMEDSSMEPLFPKNTRLIIDPDKPAKDRGYIVVKFKHSEQTVLRQLLVDANNKYLKPLSPDFHKFNMALLDDDDTICGTLVQAQYDYLD